MKTPAVTLIMTLLCLAACRNAVKAPSEEALPLFVAGDAGYACYRIPAIVKSGKETLLAFAEARKQSCSDTGDIDLVLRRSFNGGKSWEPMQVVWDAGDDVAGNPAPVVDLETGTIWLLSTWNLGTDHESRIIQQTSQDTRRIFVMKSTDHGKSWSGPREITHDVKLADWTWYATGPVHGIQLTREPYRGRLMVPCDHIESGTRHYYSHVIYSDDHGATWKLGGSTPQHQVNECTVAELADGTLMLNMRNYDRNMKNRKVSFSRDGGMHWTDITDAPGLPEPICQASLLTVGLKKDQSALFFLNPADSTQRIRMTLKRSDDGGETWRTQKVLHDGPAAYSDLVQINRHWLGCLYEAGDQSAYEGIWFRITGIR